jgi:hypothetical protein
MLNGGAGSFVLNFNFLKSIFSLYPLFVYSFHFINSIAKKQVSYNIIESL